MDRRKQRLVYLITYSRADELKIASREAFAEAVCDAFSNLDVARVVHWVVSRELHNDAEGAEFPAHYHMALKLDRRARWLRVRQSLQERHDIRVNFSDRHDSYHSAYTYVIKEDDDFILSNDHPDMSTPPPTEKAMHVRWVFFHLSHRIPQEKQVSLEPCGYCFSRLVIDYKD